MSFYFDSLPVRPQPILTGDVESFTGYLTRLGEVNGFASVNEISNLILPKKDLRVAREISDHEPLSFDNLSNLTDYPENYFRRLTFHYLLQKFDRSTHPQASSRFLGNSISEYLRWCPVCLAENGYIRLIWRFRRLQGCVHHECQLVDCCPNCRSPLQLYIFPFQIGICDQCDYDLRRSPIIPLSGIEITQIRKSHDLFSYLLKPANWTKDDFIEALGRQFARRRWDTNCTHEQVAHHIDTTVSVIEGIERGTPFLRGGRLIDYLNYTDWLGCDLLTLINDALQNDDPNQDENAYRLRKRIKQVADTLERMLETDATITYRAVSEKVNASQTTLRTNEETKERIRNAARKQAAARETQLLQDARQVIEVYRQKNEYLSQRVMAKKLGISRDKLLNRPQLLEMLSTYNNFLL
jgi:transcriptional regulator with XRE-family HTH domain